MEDQKETSENKIESLLINKYCPICGDTMHERTIGSRVYWECDDTDCGFLEVKL